MDGSYLALASFESSWGYSFVVNILMQRFYAGHELSCAFFDIAGSSRSVLILMISRDRSSQKILAWSLGKSSSGFRTGEPK
jgi:hypothetical protein